MADPTLAQDPSYLAYLRALGFEDSEARRVADTKTANIQRKVAFLEPQMAEQGQREETGISGSMESRGVYASGEHEKALAEHTYDQSNRLAGLRMGAAEDISNIQLDLATQLAALQRQQAERALATGQNLYLDQNQPYG